MRVSVIVFALAAVLAALPARALDIKPLVGGSWQELLKGHAGKSLVVHFWGLTCAPCIAELPRWAALQRERPDMAIVLVASDPAPADLDAQAAVLKKAGLSEVESWSFADPFTERLRHDIDPRWRGELPRTIQIGRDGARNATVGPADLRAIRNWFDADVGRKP